MKKYLCMLILLPTLSFSAETLISERTIGKPSAKGDGPREVNVVQRATSLSADLYRVRFTRPKHRLTMEVASPLITLSAFEICSAYGLAPKRKSSQFEPTHIDGYFSCSSEELPQTFRDRKLKRLCVDGGYLSFPQRVLCEELKLVD